MPRAFQFIQKLFDGVEVRGRSVMFFDTKLRKPIIDQRAFPKLLPTIWKQTVYLSLHFVE